MQIIKKIANFKFHYLKYYRSIHSIKTAVACLIGLGIEKHFDWPSGQWVPITIMVVMSAQTRFGGALRKAYMRFLGTVAGVITTVTTLYLFDHNFIAILIVVFLACLIFTAIASNKGDINYAGTLGGVTVLLTLSAANADITMAIQRGWYIVIGIVIALLVSRFVFPIHARDFLRINVANTLRNLKKQYNSTISMGSEQQQAIADANLEAIITEDLSDQPRLIFEAAAGSRAFAMKRQYFMEVLNAERQIHRCINLMYHSLCEIEHPEGIHQNLASVAELHNAITNELEYLATCIELTAPPQHSLDLQVAATTINKVVTVLPQNDQASKIITEHTFLFFMEQILKEINQLHQAILTIERSKKNGD